MEIEVMSSTLPQSMGLQDRNDYPCSMGLHPSLNVVGYYSLPRHSCNRHLYFCNPRRCVCTPHVCAHFQPFPYEHSVSVMFNSFSWKMPQWHSMVPGGLPNPRFQIGLLVEGFGFAFPKSTKSKTNGFPWKPCMHDFIHRVSRFLF